MLAYLKGIIDRLTPTVAFVECAGVGYSVQITLPTYTQLQNLDGVVRLWITEILREDCHDLYGFLTEEEQDFFGKLTTVSGVGPSTARLILSSYTPAELATLIEEGNVDRIKMVKGIGLKTAQRIIVDLKGKVSFEPSGDVLNLSSGNERVVVAEATSALKMLGFAEPQIKKVLVALTKENPTLSLEDLIRQALQRL